MSAKALKVPVSAISRAARMNACQASRDKALPTLMRRTPSAAKSLTVSPPALDIRMFTGSGAAALHHGRDLLAGLDSRGIEAVGASGLISLQTAKHFRQVRTTDQKAFAARREHHPAFGRIDGRTRRAHPRHRMLQVVQRRVFFPGRVLNRQAGDARLHAPPDVFADPVRMVGVAIAEVGVYRYLGRGGQLAEVGEHRRERHLIIGMADGIGKAGAGRGQGLVAKVL